MVVFTPDTSTIPGTPSLSTQCIKSFNRKFMGKFLRNCAVLFAALFMFVNVGKANVTVTVTYTGTAPTGSTLISGSPFSSLAAAITQLNASTFTGTTSVTLTCAASGAETAPLISSTGGYQITASGSGTCPIVINGNGTTITAATGLTSGTLTDGIFKLIGASYITLENFTMVENSANTTTAAATNNMTEWGVALLYSSTTKGSTYNNIVGNTISLNKSYSNTFGIYSNTNHSATNVTTLAPIASAAGENGNNTIESNNISNINVPICFSGNSTYFDAGNTIGASTLGNIINNWGGNTAPASAFYYAPGYTGYTNCYGIFMFDQANFNVNYNTLTNGSTGTSTTAALYGIYHTNLLTSGATTDNITYNTIGTSSANSGLVSATTNNTYPVVGIYTNAITSGLTLNINYNTIQGCAITGASASYFYGIENAGSVITNLYINNNTITGNTTASTSGGFYGIWNNANPVSGNIYMNNNTIAETFSAINSATNYGIYNAAGASTATLQIESNTFQNFNFTNASNSTGSIYFIDNAATTLNQYILSNNFNNLILPTTGNIYLIQDVGLGAAGTKEINSNYTTTGLSAASAALYFIYDNGSSTAASTVQYQSNNFSNVNNVGTGAMYCMYLQDGTTSAKSITGNTLNNITNLGTLYGMYVNGAGANTLSTNTLTNLNASGTLYGMDFNTSGGSNTINSNTISTLNALTSGYSAYGIYTNAGSVAYTISSNTIANIATSNQAVYGIYATNAGTLGVTGNTIDYIISGSGSPAAIYSTATGANTVSGNTIYNINSAGTATGYGIFVSGTTAASNIFNNTISNSYVGTGNYDGIYFSIPTTASLTHKVYGNTISGLSNTTGSTSNGILGIYLTGGVNTTTVDVYQNKIYGLSGLLSTAYGIQDNSSDILYAYNNIIGQLSCTGAVNPAVAGIAESYSGTSTKYIYYNTVYLTGSLTGAAVSDALYTVSSATSGTTNLTLADNILINDMTPSTGAVYAYYRTGATSFGNYNANSNNNLFYAGTPGTKNLICYNNGTTYQTLALYKAAVTTKDNNSISQDEASNFISTVGSNANYLNLNPGSSNGCYGAGLTEATTVTTDYAGVIRAPSSNTGYTGSASAPTIGAYEIIPATNAAGVTTIVTPSSLCAGTQTVQVTLTNTGSATLTSATITWTVNGVAQTNAVLTGLTIAPGASATENLGSYTFTTGAFVVAATVTLANGVTNGYPAAASGTGTFNFGLSGTYTIGASGYNFTNLTAAINAYNAAPICGNVTFLLESNYSSSSETYPLNILTNTGATGSSHFTLTIEPDASVTQTISGSNSTAMFLLNGAAYVTINGAPAGIGSSQNLTIANSNTGAPAVLVGQSSTNITVENCVITGNGQTSATYPGVVYVGAPYNAANSTIYIQNNTIASNTVLAAYGVYLLGTATYSNTSVSVTGNTISNFGTAGVYDAGYSTGEVINTNTISNNYGLAGVTYATTNYGIYYSSTAAATINGNTITCTGTTDAPTSYAYGIDFASASGAGTITNNTVNVQAASGAYTYGINYASTAAATITGNSVFSAASCAATTQYGIYLSTGPSSGTAHVVTGNYVGGSAASALGTWTNTAVGGGIYGIYYGKSGSTAVCNISGNTVSNFNLSNTSTTANSFVGIWVAGGYANIGTSGTGNANTISNVTLGGSGSALANLLYGIYTSGSGIVNVSYNTISGLQNNGTATTSHLYGIYLTATGNAYSVTNNNINTLTSYSTISGDVTSSGVKSTSSAVVGIEDNTAATGITLANNTIYTLKSSAASGSLPVFAVGIGCDISGSTGNIYDNKIYDIQNNSTATSTYPGIAGIRFYYGTWQVYNNQIILTNSTLTNNVGVYGIVDEAGTTNKFFFNSVYIGGGASTGAALSGALLEGSTTGTIENNLFYNQRTNTGTASGSNYCINFAGGSGPTTNYNELYSSGTSANVIGLVSGTSYATLALWKTNGGEGTSSLNLPVLFSQSTPPTTDLTPSAYGNCTLVNKGLAIGSGTYPPSATGITLDYAGTTRPKSPNTNPSIGAIEFISSFPTISAGSAQSVCVGGTATMAGTNPSTIDANATGAWTPTTGLSSSTSYNASYTGFAAGANPAQTWTVTDGTCSGNATVVITGVATPQGSLTGNTVCSPGAGLLTWTATAGTGPYTIVYNNGSTNVTASGVVSGTAFATSPTNPVSTMTCTLVSVTDNGNVLACARTSGFTGGTGTVTINSCTANLTLASGTSFTSATYKPGLTSAINGSNANLLGFSLSSTAACSVSQLALTLSGGNTDYTNFRIIRDVDGDGAWDNSDVTVGTVSTYGATITFTGLSENINTTPVYYLLVADVPCTSTTGDAITATMPVAGISTTATAGGTDQTGNAMTVGAFPATPAAPTSNSPQCVSTGVTITSASNATSDTWYWETSGTPASFTSANPATTPENETVSGTYYIAAKSSNGCYSAAANSITVVANPLPQGSFTGNTVCPSGNGMLTWTATSGTGPYNVIYTSGASSVTATGEISGTAFATSPATIASTSTFPLVSVTDNNGCVRSSGFTAGTATVTVSSGTTPTVPTALAASAITASTATLTWTGTATTYNVQYRVTCPVGSWVAVTGLTSATTGLTGLTAGTEYDVQVQAVNACGTTSAYTATYNFTTSCGPVTVLPWTQNFDACITTPALPACWTVSGGTWTTSTGNGYSTPPSTPNYLNVVYNNGTKYIITPGFSLTGGTSYIFSFQWAGDGYTGWTGSVLTNTSASSTGATALGSSFITSATTSSTTFATASNQFTPATTGTYYFLVKVVDNNVPYDMAFDNFTVYQAPTVTVGTVSTTSLCAGSTISVPYTITGTYTSGNVFTAQLSNSSGSFASPTAIGTLTSTSAGTITATIPGGTAAGSGYLINIISSTPSETSTNTSAAITVTSAPALTVTASQTVCANSINALAVTSTVSNYSTYTWSPVTNLYTDAGATVAYTSGTNTSVVYAKPVSAGAITYTLSGSGGGCSNTATSTVTVAATPGVPTAVAASAITASSATISWTGTGATYNLQYRTTCPVGSWVAVTGLTSATTGLTGLTAGTEYDVQVDAANTCGGVSAYTATYNFTTSCGPVTVLPWTQNFDACITTPALPACWTVSGGTWTTSTGNGYSTPPSTPNYLNVVYNNGTKYIITPGFSLTGGTSYIFSFQWAGDGYTGWTGSVLTNTSASSTGATALGSSFITSATTSSTTFATASNQFTPATTGTYYFLVKVVDNNVPYDMAFDNFTVYQAPVITVGTVSSTSVCQGASITVPYTITGTCTSGNVFTAQLSDASGSFASPTAIGNLTSTTSGSITATIPVAAATGSGYLIRVISSTPSETSVNTSAAITVQTGASFSPSAPNVCEGTSSTVITITNPGTGGSFSSITGAGSTGCSISGSGTSYTITAGTTAGAASTTYSATGVCPATLNFTVVANPSNTTTTTSICTNGTKTVATTGTGGSWTATGGGTITGTTYTPVTAGGLIGVYYTDVNSCVSPTVNFTAVTQPTFTPATPSVCPGGSTSITVNNPGTGSFGALSGTAATGSSISGSSSPYTFTAGTTSGTATSVYTYSVCTNTLSVSVNNTTPSVPTAVAASAITTSTATLAWTGTAATYNLQYRTTCPQGSWVAVTGLTSATTGLTGLASGTEYDVEVQAANACGATSAYTAIYNFTTTCGPITTLPWTQNFDACVTTPNLPVCWTTSGTGTWATSTGDGYSTPSSSPNYVYVGYNSGSKYLITPGFALTSGNSYKFTFNWAGDGYTGWTGSVLTNTSASTTGATALGTAFITSGTTSPTTNTAAAYTFTPATTNTYYFLVKVADNGVPFDMSFDDFSVYKLAANDAGVTAIATPSPICPSTSAACTATITNFGSSTLTSVNLNWSVNGGSVTTQAVTGLSLATGATTTVNFNVTLPASITSNSIQAYTSLPNGATDGNSSNDSYTSTGVYTSLSGTYTVGTGGNFTTLTAAAAYANNYGLCAATVFSLTNSSATGYTDANSGGLETFPITINTLAGASATATLTIQPATTATISATDEVFQIFDLEAASYVIINGGSGLTNNLTISTAYNGDIPVYYNGNCVSDIVNNCNILSYSTATYGGAGVYVTGGTATAGISILYNNIRDYNISSGYTAYNGIYADNASAALTITGNNIYNFANYGIEINGPTVAAAITNNNMYYTGTSTSRQQIGIEIFTAPATGTGHTITGNTIGGNGSGGNWTNSTVGTYTTNGYVEGINYAPASGTAVSNISGNTIQNFNLTGAGAYNFFRGIEIDGGYATVGSSGNGNLINNITIGTSAAAVDYAQGILTGSSGVVNINYNTISNLKNNATSYLTHSSVNYYSSVEGILDAGTGAGTINNNTIDNLTSASYVSLDISSTSTTSGTDYYAAVTGIYLAGTYTGKTIAANTIYTLASTAAQSATYYPSVIGIGTDISGSTGNIYGNKIYDLDNNSTISSPLPGIVAIRLFKGAFNVYNNQIILTNSPSGSAQTNNVRIYGISDLTGSGNEHVYNSVYIGGSTTTATGISSAWDMSVTSGTNTFKVVNNLLYNVRTNSGAGGGNYAMTVMKGGTAPSATYFTSNNNDLYSAGNTYNYLGAKGATTTITALATWQTTAPAGDAASYAKQVVFNQSTPPTTDLTPSSLTNCWLNGKGTPIVTPTYAVAVPVDYNAVTRNTTTPDIGAIEFNYTVTTALTVSSGTNSSTTSLSVCAGSTVNATTTTNALATLSYAWTTPDAYTVGNNASFSRSVTTAMAGAYTVTVSDVLACTSTATTTLVVNPLPTASISGGTSVCYSATSPNVTFTGAAGTAPYTFTYNINGGANQTVTTSAGNSVNVSVPTGTAGTFNYNLVSVQDASSTGCTQAQTGTATVVVYSNLSASLSGGSSPICYNSDPGTFTATATGGNGTYTYQWYNSGGPIGGQTASTYDPGNITGSDVYSCSVTSGSCGTVSSGNTSITVYGNLTAAISGGTTPLCYNSAPGTFTATGSGGTGTYTYQWYNSAGSIGGQTANTYAPGNLTASDVYYCSVTSGSCGTAATANKSITVYGNLSAAISGGTSPSCYSSDPGVLTATGSGATGTYTYQWFKTSGSISGATSSTYDPGSLTGSETYSCSVTSGSCGTVSTGNSVITVEPPVTSYGVVSASGGLTQTVCDHVAPNSGDPFVVSGAAGSSGSFTYQWYYQNALVAAPTGSSTSGWTACTTTDGTGYNTNSFIAAGTGNNVTYACFVIPASPVCGAGQWATNDVQVTVLTTGPSETSTGGASVCLNGTVNLSSSLSVSIPATYQWYSSTSPGFASPTLISGATATTYAPPTSASGTLYYEVVSTFSGSGCTPATSNAQTVEVYTVPSASQSGGTTPICYNSSPGTFTVTASGGSGSFTYLWYNNSGSISGATSSTYSPGNITASNSYNCTVTDVAGCGVVSTTVTNIAVDGNLTAAISGGSSPICYNTAPGTFVATASGGTTVYTYQWYNGGGLVAGATSSTYAPGPLTASNSYFCTVNSGTCGPVNTPISNVTVRANLTASITGGTSPICYNSAPGTIRTIASGGSGVYTYQWYNSGGSISGATASTYAPGALTASQTYYCVVSGGVCGSITTGNVAITVDASLSASISGGTTPVCYNSAPGTFTATGSGGTGSYTYQWYNSSSSISGATASTYAPGNLTASNAYHCSVTSGSCGSVATAATSIVVDAALSATISGGSTPICYNASPGTFTATGAGGNGTYTYQWYNDGGIIAGATSSTYAPGNLSVSDAYYCMVSGGSCGIVYTSSSAVTVGAAISVTASNTGPYVIGQNIDLSSSSAGAVTYAWSGPASYSSSNQNPVIGGATTGMTGTYTVVATQADGCSISASTDVVVTNTAVYTWTGTTSTDWTVPGNWVPTAPIGGPNACAVDVVIPSAVNNPVISTGVQVGSIQMNGNAQLTLNSANIQVCKNWVGASGSVATVNGSGLVELNGSSLQKITGSTKMEELKLSNTAGASMQSGATLDIYTALDLAAGNFDATGGTLTFKSTTVNSVGIIDNFSSGYAGTLSGSIAAERYYATSLTYNQHYMGSPVNAPSLAQFSASGTPGFVIDPWCDETRLVYNSPYGTVFSFDETHGATCGMQQWKVVTTGNAENGMGYSVVKSGNGVMVLNGTANLNATYSLPGLTNSNWSNSTVQGHTENSGWQLVSNPYLATLNLNTIPSGFDGQVQVWNANGNFAGSYQPGNIGTDATIAPFQAFMVHKTDAGGTATFTMNGTDRVRTPQQFFLQNANQLNIVAANVANGMLDQTTVAFNPAATDTFDAAIDAVKFAGALTRHTLYTVNNGKWMARNILHDEATTSTVPMGFEPGSNGTFRLSFNGLNTFDATSYIYLEDKALNIMYNVRNGDYTFTADSADGWNRFVLHFTPAALITTADASCSGSGTINIQQPGMANWNYTLTDTSHAIITSGTLNQSQDVTIGVAAGTYTLTLIDTNSYTVTKTIFVNGPEMVAAGFNASSETVQTGQSVTLTATTSATATYQWTFGNGTSSTGISTSVSYAQPGVYAITLVVTNQSGCSASQTKNVTVTAGNATGLNNLSGNGNLKIWSNSNKVYVDFTGVQMVNTTIVIYDMLGQQISNKNVTPGNLVFQQEFDNIDAEYLIVMVRNDDKVTTKKVFIDNYK